MHVVPLGKKKKFFIPFCRLESRVSERGLYDLVRVTLQSSGAKTWLSGSLSPEAVLLTRTQFPSKSKDAFVRSPSLWFSQILYYWNILAQGCLERRENGFQDPGSSAPNFSNGRGLHILNPGFCISEMGITLALPVCAKAFCNQYTSCWLGAGGYQPKCGAGGMTQQEDKSL